MNSFRINKNHKKFRTKNSITNRLLVSWLKKFNFRIFESMAWLKQIYDWIETKLFIVKKLINFKKRDQFLCEILANKACQNAHHLRLTSTSAEWSDPAASRGARKTCHHAQTSPPQQVSCSIDRISFSNHSVDYSSSLALGLPLYMFCHHRARCNSDSKRWAQDLDKWHRSGGNSTKTCWAQHTCKFDVLIDLLKFFVGIFLSWCFKSERKPLQCECQGSVFKLGDFQIRLGAVTQSSSNRGLLVEVTYSSANTNHEAWGVILEFLNSTFGWTQQTVQQDMIGSFVRRKQHGSIYTPEDTIFQYFEHFNALRSAAIGGR